MNKFKKIGLTALAGSLAAVTAAQADVSFSGNTLVTYMDDDKGGSAAGSTNGNGFGQQNNIDFSFGGKWTMV